MASSSFVQERSIASPKLYDAFISHRGPDVKETLAKRLYDLLQERACRAFLDREEIEGGDSIPFAIDNGICSSVVQIAIFSRRYAESSWCLDELVLMLQQTDALFIPVFYDVQPWELGDIENEKSQYAAAFSDYQRRGRNLHKLDKWKSSLKSASKMSGYEKMEHEDDLCEEIVSRVLQEMKKRVPLHVAKYPVGLPELVKDFERSCSKTVSSKVGIVGIFGLGGVGKTTLAKELFNGKRSAYDGSCFISDVRESHARRDLHSLHSKLFKDLFHEDRKFENIDEGIEQLKHRLGKAKHLHFLIVLDDINHQDQLNTLLPEAMLSTGSLIIITTRDQSVLRGADFRYGMKEMNCDHAKILFSSHAFGGRDVPTAYEKLVESFVKFSAGLPLSLKVLGAHLYGRNEKYWELEFEKVKHIQPKDIMQSLKISFDGLDSQEKQIFIDIAYFFNNNIGFLVKNVAISIWKASGWRAELAVQTLQNKCLLELGIDDEFQMHDHIRDLGRQLADDFGPPRLWKPELLRSMEAMGFEQILEKARGFKEIPAKKGCRCFHSFKDSSLEAEITYFISSSNDTSETELLWLEVDDEEGILESIPSWIPLKKLLYLSVFNVRKLWSSFQLQTQTNTQACFELRLLLISESPSLQNLPDLIAKFNHLEELHIVESLENTDKESLVQSLQLLANLRVLELFGCGISLSGILNLSGGRDSPNFEASTSSRMNSLETIEFGRLDNISRLVISGEMCPRLRSLKVRSMENLKEMDLNQLQRLNALEVYQCPKLETISGLSSVAGLQVKSERPCCLERIDIGECRQLQSMEGLEELQGLKGLVIQVPEYEIKPCVWNCVCGLKRLPLEYMVLIGKAVPKAKRNLNVEMFSGVVDAEAVAEVKRGEYTIEMTCSLSAITIYSFLVTSTGYPSLYYKSPRNFHMFPHMGDWMVTGLLTAHDSFVNLSRVKIKKGFMVTINKSDERKALKSLQIIFDRLYKVSMVPKLQAYDVVKRKRM